MPTSLSFIFSHITEYTSFPELKSSAMVQAWTLKSFSEKKKLIYLHPNEYIICVYWWNWSLFSHFFFHFDLIFKKIRNLQCCFIQIIIIEMTSFINQHTNIFCSFIQSVFPSADENNVHTSLGQLPGIRLPNPFTASSHNLGNMILHNNWTWNYNTIIVISPYI